MATVFFNTLTRKKEEFAPLAPGKVGLYTCGPTVHDYAHVGNFRTYMFEDLLRRYLQWRGYEVTQVMNITDVDDKTIRKSREQGVTLGEYTQVVAAIRVAAVGELVEMAGCSAIVEQTQSRELRGQLARRFESMVGQGAPAAHRQTTGDAHRTGYREVGACKGRSSRAGLPEEQAEAALTPGLASALPGRVPPRFPRMGARA